MLITTVGPFYLHGTLVLRACASMGTHYIESTGETPWVYEMCREWHDVARGNGACAIVQCAMNSAPADMAAYAFIQTLTSQDSPQEVGTIVHAILKWRNGLSVGMVRSLVGVAGAYEVGKLREAIRQLALCVKGKQPEGRPMAFGVVGTKRFEGVGLVTNSVVGISDTGVVYRSGSLMG